MLENGKYQHGVDEGRLPQIWSSWGLKAEIRPSQNHCRLGSRGESGPAPPHTQTNYIADCWEKSTSKSQQQVAMSALRHCRMCVCLHVFPTDRLVFDGRAGHTEVQLSVLFDAGIDQSLHGALILEQQEGVSWRKRHYLCCFAQARRGHIGI